MVPVRGIALFIIFVFVLPALATMAWWAVQDRPASWRMADWSSSGLLPVASQTEDAAIYVLAARTGGMKGALSVHSWLVIKRPGADAYERYDKVGWGSPVRRNGYAADARWYSNEPFVVHAVHGAEAERLIPEFDRASADYPHARQGGYRIWPGPNSNSFVAWVLETVPDFGGRLPPNAVGRDFTPYMLLAGLTPDRKDIRINVFGVAGLTVGAASGIELHIGGLVAGIELRNPALKIPGYGRLGLRPGH